MPSNSKRLIESDSGNDLPVKPSKERRTDSAKAAAPLLVCLPAGSAPSYTNIFQVRASGEDAVGAERPSKAQTSTYRLQKSAVSVNDFINSIRQNST